MEAVGRAAAAGELAGLDARSLVLGMGIGLELARRHPSVAAAVYGLLREPQPGDPAELAEGRWQSIEQVVADGSVAG